MDRDTLDFFCTSLGYNWLYQLEQALELVQEELKSIIYTISGYDIKTKRNLTVHGRTANNTFTAVYYMSDKWTDPLETIYSLRELRIE